VVSAPPGSGISGGRRNRTGSQRTVVLDLAPRRILFWLLTFGVWGILFAPLIFTSRTLYPAWVGKTIFFRVAVEALLILYVALALSDKQFRPRSTPLVWCVTAYAGALLLSTLASPDPYLSWWGNLEWMEGVFGFLHYIAFFIVLSGLFRAARDWLRFFKVSLMVSVIVACISITQRVIYAQVQAGSTLGKPPHAACYFLFQIFFAAMVTHWERKRAWCWCGVGLLALNFAALCLTAERGPLVGLCAGLMALAAATWLTGHGDARLRSYSLIMLVVLLAAPFLIRLGRGTRAVAWNYALQRLSAISLEDATTRSRLFALNSSWRAWKARPILGYGPELYSLAHFRYLDPEMLKYEPNPFERAHNKLLDVLVMDGLAGFIPYLGIFVAAGLRLKRALRLQRFDAATVLWTFAMLVAYFVQNLFLFDTPVSYAMFYAFLGFVDFLGEEGASEAQPSLARLPTRGRRLGLRPGQQAVVGALAAVMIFSIYEYNAKPFREAELARSLFDSVNDPQEFLKVFQEGLSCNSWATPEFVWAAVHVLTTSRQLRDSAYSEVFREVSTEAESKAVRRNEFDPRVYWRLGSFYDERALFDPSLRPEAEGLIKASIHLAPQWATAYFALSKTYLRAGRLTEAIAVARQAIAICPDASLSRWYYAFILLTAHREQEGLVELEGILPHYNYHNPGDLNLLASAYYRLHKLPQAIQYQTELVELQPSNAFQHARLAWFYKESGDAVGASREMQAAAKLDPRYSAGAQEFLESLPRDNSPTP
jgi:O-antigen ligase